PARPVRTSGHCSGSNCRATREASRLHADGCDRSVVPLRRRCGASVAVSEALGCVATGRALSPSRGEVSTPRLVIRGTQPQEHLARGVEVWSFASGYLRCSSGVLCTAAWMFHRIGSTGADGELTE